MSPLHFKKIWMLTKERKISRPQKGIKNDFLHEPNDRSKNFIKDKKNNELPAANVDGAAMGDGEMGVLEDDPIQGHSGEQLFKKKRLKKWMIFCRFIHFPQTFFFGLTFPTLAILKGKEGCDSERNLQSETHHHATSQTSSRFMWFQLGFCFVPKKNFHCIEKRVVIKSLRTLQTDV